MRLTRVLVAPLAVLASIAGDVRAQGLIDPAENGHPRGVAAAAAAPVWIEAFVSRQRGEAAGRRAEGWGGRLLWPLAPGDDEPAGLLGGLRRHLSLGAFAVRTTPPARLGAWHLGGQVDARLLSRVLGGRVEPLLSLGAGAYREELAGHRGADVPVVLLARPIERPAPIRAVRPPLTTTHGALSSGAALRLHLAPGLAARVDVRQLLVMDGPRGARELAVGMAVGR